MRTIILAPSTCEQSVETEYPLRWEDLLDARTRADRIAQQSHLTTPAIELYAGRTHLKLKDTLATLRRSTGQAAVDVAFLSPAFGLVREHERLVPYSCSFADLSKDELAQWRDRVQLRDRVTALLASYDLALILLSDQALRSLGLPLLLPASSTQVIFVNRDDLKILPKSLRAHPVVTGQDEAIAHGVKATELKWHLLGLLADHVTERGEEVLHQVQANPDCLFDLLQPRFPKTALEYRFHNPFAWKKRHKVRFFMPECDDRVDSRYDFFNDRPHYARQSDLDDAFSHDPELYGAPNYDGILISKNQVEERQFKRAYIEKVGVHRYLRVPQDFPVMGDCGAFTYVGEDRPPYETGEILRYYQRLGFNYGVSLDHLIIPPIYTRQYWSIRRLDDSALELSKEAHARVLKARRAEVSVPVQEDLVTYFPEEGIVVAERKMLSGVGRSAQSYPDAIRQLASLGHHAPFNSSRLARLRSYNYYLATVPKVVTATRPFLARMKALSEDLDFARYTPISKKEYEAIMRRKATREAVGETLRSEKVVFYPDSADAVIEQTAIDFDQIRFRFLLTLWNGRAFFRQHREGGFSFMPIGAVQGWHGPLFRLAVRHFARFGYRFLAIGGVAMARNEEIIEVLRGVQPEIQGRDLELHLFGVARNEQIEAFIRLGVTSFDSTGPLRKAWLNATANYLTEAGPTYAALRIPDPHSSPKAKAAINPEAGITLDVLRRLEGEALRKLRAYDQGEENLEETLDAIMAYDELLGEDRNFRDLFRRTLEDKPWKHCPCAICQRVGVEVMIFRGNDRNRRRGFHNTWVFYQEFQKILQDGGSASVLEPRSFTKPASEFRQLALELDA